MAVVYFPGGPTTDLIVVPWPGPQPEPVREPARLVLMRVPIEQGVGSCAFGFSATANGIVPGVLTITRTIAAGSDDAMEPPSLSPMLVEGNHLMDLVNDQIGLRFTDLPPQNSATISYAAVVQTLDGGKNDAEGTWFGHDVDDSATFTTTDGDVTDRVHTTASVAWTANDIGLSGEDASSPNLAAVLQEIVDRPGWQPGNNVSFIYVHNSTTDQINTATLEGGAAARLYVEYRPIPQVLGVADVFFAFTATATGTTRVLGVGACAFGFTAASAGTPRVFGAGACSFGFTAMAMGVARSKGVGACAFGFSAAATGVARSLGVGTCAFGFTAAASGVVTGGPVTGVGTCTFGFTVAATGRVRAFGLATGAFGFTAAGSGFRRTRGSGVCAFGWTTVATGRPRSLGLGACVFGFSAVALGRPRVRGLGTCAFGFTAAGSGIIPGDVITGVGLCAFGFTAAGSGKVTVRGVGLVAFGFSATGLGRPRVYGSGSGFYAFIASTNGRVRIYGASTMAFGWTLAGSGFVGERITPPERIIKVPAESRTIVVPAETRTLVIP